MNKTHLNIWVLTDNRTGNSVQAVAVAEELGERFEIKYLEYNIFAKLPNFLLGGSKISLTKKSNESLVTDYPPELVISAGRRTAGIATYLKKKYPKVKLVQIMKPCIKSSLFDMIVLPQHDKLNDNNAHILRTIGALNNISHKLSKNQDDFTNIYPKMTKFIGVLIGGNTKEYKFSYKDADNLGVILENIVAYSDLPLFITFSRRTPDVIKNLFREKFQGKHVIFDPSLENANPYNPYLGILQKAKYLVITGDSISMCSEAASSGKPLYIYIPENFTSKKHKYFTQQLIDLGIARSLTFDSASLEEYKYLPLNEVAKVSKAIKEMIENSL